MDDMPVALAVLVYTAMVVGISVMVTSLYSDIVIPHNTISVATEKCEHNEGLQQVSIDVYDYAVICNNGAEFAGSVDEME